MTTEQIDAAARAIFYSDAGNFPDLYDYEEEGERCLRQARAAIAAWQEAGEISAKSGATTLVRSIQHQLGHLQFRQTGQDPKTNGFAFAEVPAWLLRQWLEAAQGIAARSDETRSGSAEGKSPVPTGCAQPQSGTISGGGSE